MTQKDITFVAEFLTEHFNEVKNSYFYNLAFLKIFAVNLGNGKK
jgi:hypothetical protein